jgi:hypothetical protein
MDEILSYPEGSAAPLFFDLGHENITQLYFILRITKIKAHE